MRTFFLGLFAGVLLGAGLSVLSSSGDGPPAPPASRPGPEPVAVAPSPAEPPEEEGGERPGPPETSGPEIPPLSAPEGPVLDFVTRTLVNRGGMGKIADWERRLPLLLARKAEVIPILEDWIRRWEEISRSGAGIATAYLAYADLAGPDAIPLLEEHLYDDPGNWGACRDALIRIDDPRAAAALHRFQESRRPGVLAVVPGALRWGSESSRRLLREWADHPPEHHPDLRWKARRELFRSGTEPEKERVWREADALQRRALLDPQMFKRWPEPWPERYRATVLAALESEDPGIRAFALDRIAGAADFFGEKAVQAAEEVLTRDLQRLDPQAEATDLLRRRLQGLVSSFGRIHREAERQRKIREVLRPR